MGNLIIHYEPWLKDKARFLRNNSTVAEILLWNELKRGQLRGCDFHRQKPIGKYIVDFYCPKLRLAIEIDGDSHDGREAADAGRQRWIESKGIAVLRFDDLAVKFRIGDVLSHIEAWIDRRRVTHPPPPSPPSADSAEDPSKGGE